MFFVLTRWILSSWFLALQQSALGMPRRPPNSSCSQALPMATMAMMVQRQRHRPRRVHYGHARCTRPCGMMAPSSPVTPNPLPYTYSTLIHRPTSTWTCPNIESNESVVTLCCFICFLRLLLCSPNDSSMYVKVDSFTEFSFVFGIQITLHLKSASCNSWTRAAVSQERCWLPAFRNFCRLRAGLRPNTPGYDWVDNVGAHSNGRESFYTARGHGIALSTWHPTHSRRTQWHSAEPVDRHSGGCAALYPARHIGLAEYPPNGKGLVYRKEGPNSDRASFGTRSTRRTWPAMTSATDDGALCQVPDQEDYSPCAS
jgi:hypothetical protein